MCGSLLRGGRGRVVFTHGNARIRRRGRRLLYRVLARGRFLRPSCCRANRHGVTAAAVALLDNVGFERKRTNHTMQLEEQAACVAQRLALGVPAPERGCLSEAVGARCRGAVCIRIFGSWAARPGWCSATKTGFGRRGDVRPLRMAGQRWSRRCSW